LAIFRRQFEPRIVFVALAMLLIAQLGAQLHTYAHGAAAGSGENRQAAASTHVACNDCLSYAPLLAAAGAPTGLAPVGRPVLGFSQTKLSASLVERSPTLAFRSRAPPLTR
jgi:hypothetical protein